MGEMPANPIQLLGAGLVVTVWLAATSGAASAPATGSRLAGAQGREDHAFRMSALKVRGKTVVIVTQAPVAEFPRFLPIATALLASLRSPREP